MNATLTIGALTECPACMHKRCEPGAKWCPDCTIIERLYERGFAEELETWLVLDGYTPSAKLAKDPDFQKYSSRDEFIKYYKRWRTWNMHRVYEQTDDGEYCPHCGRRLD